MIVLERFAYTPMGTFGRLNINGWECYTVERPWHNNQPFISCIPEGIYTLQKTVTPSHGNTFILHNSDLDVHKYKQDSGRYAILIHSGNTMDDIEGCIAPGESLGYVHNKWAVLNSRNTMRQIRDRILDDISLIDITRYEP